MLDLLYLGLGGFDEGSLVVDDVLQAVDELPHFPGGDPARAFGGREALATSRSFVRDEGCDTRHPGLKVLGREAIRGFLGVCGRGLGCPPGGSAIGPGLASVRHTTVLYGDNINHNVVVPAFTVGKVQSFLKGTVCVCV